MAKLPWTPWHKVVKLRDDLRTGKLSMNMFAADLYEVMMQNGKRPVYEDPTQFFSLTFATHNLRNLVRDVALRLAGKNDKAVRQLELTYGGGKTHTLITMRHLVNDPANLPDLPAVREFTETIGQTPPQARVAALCFDNLHVETGMEVRSPDGHVRRLKNPWSLLAYQIAGDDGLKLLHADGKAEELQAPPATADMAKLLSIPHQSGMGTLVVLDEVLLYAKMKCHMEPGWLDVLIGFFQYLTQAATKVDRCCVVASLLSSEPKDQADPLGRKIVSALYDIFQRQREEVVQPVEKDDVAEVLRRRLFDPKSVENRGTWAQHVIAALKGIAALDDQTAKQGAAAEERYLKSYPFHPELTEVFYTKWASGIERFQKTRGVLRTFALALREAEKWDESPLVGPAVFLSPPKQAGLSEAARELVAIADTIVSDGQAMKWTGIIENELRCARQVQTESVGLKLREIEQAVMATFLHSQPVGQSAHTRDIEALLGATRPDKIELEKGLARWAQTSHWLDDSNMPETGDALPTTWRIGNRPNLNQMHAVASKNVPPAVVKVRLIDEIDRLKALTSGASAAGVRVHTRPKRPRDIEDDGQFHYAVLGPSAASDSGKPSPEAKRYLDETTGPDKPRVYRNAVLLLTPNKDGLSIAEARVKDYLGWEQVKADLEKQKKDGTVDLARMQTLAINLQKGRKRIPDAIRQAYCTVVTVDEGNQNQAFKITVGDEPHFTIIKGDRRSRIQDTAVTADALLPGGPYDLWKEGETSRRVKDLSGAFAQLPHLPKMLKAQAILDTLVDGCLEGTFVLKLTRPDGTFRTWWRSKPDENALTDPALELVLPEAAELAELSPHLVSKDALPGLWAGESVTVKQLVEYFDGSKVVQVEKDGYEEPQQIPKAGATVVHDAVGEAVEGGLVWLTSGPASVLGEPVPAGVLTDAAELRVPPAMVGAPEILPENLPDAWTDGTATALSVATALSNAKGVTLPWKTVRDVINASLQARFTELAEDSGQWPCEFPAAPTVKLKVSEAGGKGGGEDQPNVRVGEAQLEPVEIQDLGDAVAKLWEIKARSNVPIVINVRIEVGDGKEMPPEEVVSEINELLSGLKDGFQVN